MDFTFFLFNFYIVGNHCEYEIQHHKVFNLNHLLLYVSARLQHK